jgi:hypothetical protein
VYSSLQRIFLIILTRQSCATAVMMGMRGIRAPNVLGAWYPECSLSCNSWIGQSASPVLWLTIISTVHHSASIDRRTLSVLFTMLYPFLWVLLASESCNVDKILLWLNASKMNLSELSPRAPWRRGGHQGKWRCLDSVKFEAMRHFRKLDNPFHAN